MADEKFEKWVRSQNLPLWGPFHETRVEAWTAALASRSTTPGKLEELIDGLVGKLNRLANDNSRGNEYEAGKETAYEISADDVAALKPALREAVDAEVSAAYAKGAADMREDAAVAIDKDMTANGSRIIRALPIRTDYAAEGAKQP